LPPATLQSEIEGRFKNYLMSCPRIKEMITEEERLEILRTWPAVFYAFVLKVTDKM